LFSCFYAGCHVKNIAERFPDRNLCFSGPTIVPDTGLAPPKPIPNTATTQLPTRLPDPAQMQANAIADGIKSAAAWVVIALIIIWFFSRKKKTPAAANVSTNEPGTPQNAQTVNVKVEGLGKLSGCPRCGHMGTEPIDYVRWFISPINLFLTLCTFGIWAVYGLIKFVFKGSPYRCVACKTWFPW
jgi:hypothetical protein